MEQRTLCSAHAIPAGYILWSRRKEFRLTGLVSCPLWKSWQAGWDRQQDTRVLESHRRLEGRDVPQHTEIIRVRLSECFPVCITRLLGK